MIQSVHGSKIDSPKLNTKLSHKKHIFPCSLNKIKNILKNIFIPADEEFIIAVRHCAHFGSNSSE